MTGRTSRNVRKVKSQEKPKAGKREKSKLRKAVKRRPCTPLCTPLLVYTPPVHPSVRVPGMYTEVLVVPRWCTLEAGAVGLGGPRIDTLLVGHRNPTSRLVRKIGLTTSLCQAKRHFKK